jgi:Circadian oscillating protein COP23
MKIHLVVLAVLASVTVIESACTVFSKALAQTPTAQSYASPKSFSCKSQAKKVDKKTSRQVPATIGHTDVGEIIIYYWIKPYYSNPSEDPLTRCTRVASVLNELNPIGRDMKRIKAGQVNGKPAICVANNSSSSCDRLIFTLEATEKPEAVLEDLQIAMKGLPRADKSRIRIRQPLPPGKPKSGRVRGGGSR